MQRTVCGTLGNHSEDQMDQISQKKMIQREVLDKPTPEIEVIEEGISCQHERTDETPESSTGTKRVSVLFQGIAKHLRNRILNGVTRQEGHQSNVSESSSRKVCPFNEGCTMVAPASVLQECQVWDKEKRRYIGQPNPTSHLDKELISKAGDCHLHDVLRHIHSGAYQSSALCLDVKTAGNNIVVKSDLKSAFWTVEDQCYPKTRKRFNDPQVLSITSFHSGQHYWVVETSKSGNWRIGMCYPSIARKGFRSYIGCSNKSWSLCKWNNEYSLMHNCKELHLSQGLSCQRLAIFLDYKAGQLSFYELGNPVRLLHTFTATFTEPLHAVFRVWLDSLGSSWILIKD